METSGYPANTRCRTNVVLTLGQLLRRWANNKMTLVRRLVFAGMTHFIIRLWRQVMIIYPRKVMSRLLQRHTASSGKTTCIYRPLGYKRVYLPLFKVADTPFYIQGDIYLMWSGLIQLVSYVDLTCLYAYDAGPALKQHWFNQCAMFALS